MSVALAGAAVTSAVPLILDAVKSLFATAGGNAISGNSTDISLTAYAKTGRISSRVYIDASVASDPVIADILKTVQTQYCGLILTALQMNQFVSAGSTVQDLLKVVASEDYGEHQDISSSFGVDSDRLSVDEEERAGKIGGYIAGRKVREKVKDINENTLGNKPQLKPKGTTGKISEGDHLPTGKVIEVTMVNPNNPAHKVTINLLVQLAPYIVPEELAVQFIVKDAMPSFYQRLIQWKTGEISFWKDLILKSDIIHHREQMLKLDPSGTFADMMGHQQESRFRTMKNVVTNDAARARNIANSVLIFNEDTVMRAKVESGVDFTSYDSRQQYFGHTFAMIIVVVDITYNQVTFYYNGISDVSTFSFDQMRLSNKGGSSLDLVSVMNALNQGRSPKF